MNSKTVVIGEAIKRNFNKFAVREKKGGMGKKSDWPALKASREKSGRSFKEKYRRISIFGITDRNSTLRLETAMSLPIEIELTSTISAHCEPSELGSRVLKIFRSEIIERPIITKLI